MTDNDSLKLSEIRDFARMRNISYKEATKILFHENCLKIYGNHKRYPKEIHKIIFEDPYYGTRALTTKIIY